MNGQLIGELGKVFEKYGYNLIAIEKKNTDKEQVNITIEDNKNGQNN
jgi:nucleoside diphosphate kinase